MIVWCIKDSCHEVEEFITLEEVVFCAPVVKGVDTMAELIETWISNCPKSNEVRTIRAAYAIDPGVTLFILFNIA
jgi:hypothetical protein